MRKRRGRNSKGQTTIEYVLMVAFGAIFSLQIMKFFNDVFREGLRGLEGNVQQEMSNGAGSPGFGATDR